MKKDTDKKTEWLHIRLTKKQKNKIIYLSKIMSCGNVSQWVIEASLKYSKEK